ncbi:MAG: nuclear transport factor 2 family protein [Candidatus Sericytochromatia bacterium]
MSREVVNRFIQALERLERERDLDPMVGLFTADARVSNLLMPDPAVGQPGARGFWAMYRDTFGAIASRFDSVVIDGDRAALEWTATGTGHRGQPIRYRGVSMLEIRGDRVSRFMAYFDPADLGAQLGRPLAGRQAGV